MIVAVSKLFRAYGLYNSYCQYHNLRDEELFQSSFELTGYITWKDKILEYTPLTFQSSFELTGYITNQAVPFYADCGVSKLFRAYGLYNI